VIILNEEFERNR